MKLEAIDPKTLTDDQKEEIMVRELVRMTDLASNINVSPLDLNKILLNQVINAAIVHELDKRKQLDSFMIALDGDLTEIGSKFFDEGLGDVIYHNVLAQVAETFKTMFLQFGINYTIDHVTTIEDYLAKARHTGGKQ